MPVLQRALLERLYSRPRNGSPFPPLPYLHPHSLSCAAGKAEGHIVKAYLGMRSLNSYQRLAYTLPYHP